MIKRYHPNLSQEKWNGFSQETQILNIASELFRAKNLLQRADEQEMTAALNRAFELLDLTLNDKKWRTLAKKELWRLREILGQFYISKKKNLKAIINIIKTLLYFTNTTSQVEVS